MSMKTVEMTLHYRDIKIVFDGHEVDCVDVNGDSTEPFIIDGSVYIPARAAANAMGLDIDWDGSSNSVHFSGVPNNMDEINLTNIDGATAYALVQKAQNYAATLSPPAWAEQLVSNAIASGVASGIIDNITDGTRLCTLAPRYEAAIMALRAKEQAISQMTNEQAYQILQKAQAYLADQPVPSWATSLLADAIDDNITDGMVNNITDGERLNMLTPRYEAAIMAYRAKQQAIAEASS